jgi:hypothetical protein
MELNVSDFNFSNNVLSLVNDLFDIDSYVQNATPTLFNAGTPRPQLSSCFLVGYFHTT